jgi:hypothetical protein
VTARYAIRVLAPPNHRGDIFQCALLDTHDQYEAFRLDLGDPDNFEVIQLDDNSQPLEPLETP